MSQNSIKILIVVALMLMAAPLAARMSLEADRKTDTAPVKSLAGLPFLTRMAHRVGKIHLGITNNGTLATHNPEELPSTDYFTGETVPDCEYPRHSDNNYLYSGAFWIGAVVNNGRDTLVSVGADGWQRTQEMFPDAAPFGNPVYRSIKDPTQPEYEDAISEEDYICVYMDTLTEGVEADFFGRPHLPLHIEVTQTSMAWSYSYAEDFVLFDYKIRNIGASILEDVYMGVYIDADVLWGTDDGDGAKDDICGFLAKAVDSCGSCEYLDTTVFAAWIADNDGDYEPKGTSTTPHPVPAVTATKIIRTPAESLNVSFNWWIGEGNPAKDFGPREQSGKGELKEEYRDFRTGGTGTPEGDLNKYYVLRNREFDYDQVRTGIIQPNDDLWLYPNQNLADDFANGFDTRYLLSFGPFVINVGQTLPISFAYVAGDSLHHPGPYTNDFLPDDPDEFYRNLDFSDLALNAKWASWVYDNPGVDTDDDGYFGEMEFCPYESLLVRIDTAVDTSADPDTLIIRPIWDHTAIETCWVLGDGVPDFKGASPPPAPDFWLEPSIGKLKVRFNGQRSETTRDAFSRDQDFEGYRVYMARDRRSASFVLLTSYDLEDYNKYILTPLGQWSLRDTPFTMAELRCLYGSGDDPCHDIDFNPLAYTTSAPYIHPDYSDSIFYFTRQDWNQHRLGIDTRIEKIYPNEPYPSSIIPDSAQPEELTEDGFLKYFEYKFEINDLLSSVPWYVNITAFDYGSPQSGLSSLETPVDAGAKMAYALTSTDDVATAGLKVIAYPNPYRNDADYRDAGYENRLDRQISVDHTRRITFANLPPHCSITIFTIDGDIIKEIEHDIDNPPTDYFRSSCFTSTTDCWNMITRNTQLVVTGLYYYTIEIPGGETQIGKLVIIM